MDSGNNSGLPPRARSRVREIDNRQSTAATTCGNRWPPSCFLRGPKVGDNGTNELEI